MMRTLGVVLLFSIVSGCDFFHTKSCEWYLVPEPEHKNLVEDGWVALCARNYVTGKQKCYYQAKFSYAEKIVDKPLTLDSLKHVDGSFPREIVSVKSCTPSDAESKRLLSQGGG